MLHIYVVYIETGIVLTFPAQPQTHYYATFSGMLIEVVFLVSLRSTSELYQLKAKYLHCSHETCLVHIIMKRIQNRYPLSIYVREVYTGTELGVLTVQECVLNQVLTIRVGLCIYMRYTQDRMRSTYYPGVCTKPGTYYRGWFMYMRYIQGQNEEYLLSWSMTTNSGIF